MKTKTWILILGGVFLVLCLAVLAQHLLSTPAKSARVLSDGQLVAVLDLDTDQTLRVEYAGGYNEITVAGGRVSVTGASCPDQDCVRCGAKNAGAPIVCLPNRLTIQFADTQGLDGITR